MLQHVDQLVRPLRHVLQGVEHGTPLAHRRRRRQYIHQHLHARGSAALQGRHRGGAVLGRRKQSGEALENRLGVDAPQRDRILPPHAARLRNLLDRKSTRLNSSHSQISYAVFCLKKKKKKKKKKNITERKQK